MLEVTINGVALSSRSGLQREIDAMTRVLAALPLDVRGRLASIFCDSKACADYSIDVKPGHWVDGLDRLLDDTFYHLLGGHNGLTITELSPPCDAPLPPLRFATMGTGFYASPRWLKLRHAMLSHHGARCQCCGVAFPEAIVQVDHIPRPRQPPDPLPRLQPRQRRRRHDGLAAEGGVGGRALVGGRYRGGKPLKRLGFSNRLRNPLNLLY